MPEKGSERGWPPFSTGRLGGGFRLLKAYVDEAGPEGIVPDRAVFDTIRSIASTGSKVEDVVMVVAELFIDKIDPAAAARAYRRVYGVGVGGDEAVRAVAKEVAMWAVEMAETLGVIRLRGYLR